MATLSDAPRAKPPKPVPPEALVGDLIQPGHRHFGLIWINFEGVARDHATAVLELARTGLLAELPRP